MNIQVKKLREGAVLPTRGSEKAAGYDLYACLDQPVVIYPNTNVKIGTGLAIAVPEGYFGAVFARSGLAAKQNLRPANCVGVCDADYRGEYMVALHNDGNEPRTVNPGDRIAQLVVMPFLPVEFSEVDELDETARGAGGFGSTGQ
ncbi:MAG: dUTP diphosphatase [Clostridia bacterium]|nr:dUTP diphosphatase [Clostridia bacterium]